jgi:hypothetical protein
MPSNKNAKNKRQGGGSGIIPVHRANNIEIMLMQFQGMTAGTICEAIQRGDPEGTS